MNNFDTLESRRGRKSIRYGFLKKITAVAIALVVGLSFAQAQSANFVFVPQTATVDVGDVFNMQVLVDINGTPVDAAEIHLEFDPAFLEVVSLTPDNSFLNVVLVQPAFDNDAGTIEYAAGAFSGFPTTDFPLITIGLRALAPTSGTDLVFNTDGQIRTDITFAGHSVLNQANEGTVIINGAGDDTEDPVISNCPSNITVGNDQGDCEANVSWTAPTASDNVGVTSFTSSHSPGAAFGIGTTVVTYTAMDAAGNTATCSFNVNVTDDQDPTLTACPGDITVAPDDNGCEAVVNWTPPAPGDNCPGVDLSSTHQPGSSFPAGTTTVTYTATDEAGNTATCSFDVTVQDGEGPVVTGCVDDINVVSDPGECGAFVTWPPPVSGDCSQVTLSYAPQGPNTFFEIGKTTVTITFTDMSGNVTTCDFNVDVRDEELPAIDNCPANIIESTAPDACEAAVFWPAITVSDNCPGGSLDGSHLSGENFPIGVTQVVYTATDAFFNEAVCNFTVTVVDDVDPVIAGCPGDITLNVNSGSNSTVVNWTAPTATDNCTNVNLVGSAQPGSSFPVGITQVTYTATDAAGNTAECSFTVTINDNEAPLISGCPVNITVGNDAGQCSAAVSWTEPTATDDGVVESFTSTHDPGDIFPVGTTTVTYTATDDDDNTSTCSFDVVVEDSEAPVLTGCPANISMNAAPGGDPTAVNWTAPVATDNCPGYLLVSTHVPGDLFPVGSTGVTYTVTDEAGNTDVCSFTVTISNDDSPVISGCPDNITINNDEDACTGTATWTEPTATDNGAVESFTSTHEPGDPFPIGTTTVTYTATDDNGNTTSCSFTVTVVDSQAPELADCPLDIEISVGLGEVSINVDWDLPNVFDNCPGFSLDASHQPGDLFLLGTTTVTYTATDASGNEASCSFDVTIGVNIDPAPVISNCPNDITVGTDDGDCAAVVSWTEPTATDNGVVVSFVSTHEPGETFQVGETEVVYTATDDSGKMSTCEFIVTVEDDEAPVYSNCPEDITVDTEEATCAAQVFWLAPEWSDNCPGGSETASHDPGDVFSLGATTVTYTATDAAGNEGVCSFTVTVEDNTPALIVCPNDVVVNNDPGICGAVVTFDDPTTLDGCGLSSATADIPSGSLFQVGADTVTFTATDQAGNTSTCSFTVTVEDTEEPVISCPENILVDNDPGACGATVNFSGPVATDNCNSYTNTQTAGPASGDFFPLGTTSITFIASDGLGSNLNCSFTVTVSDTEAPNIDCYPDFTVANAPGTCEAEVELPVPGATDNCGAVTVEGRYRALAADDEPVNDWSDWSADPLSGTFGVGTYEVNWKATGEDGNIGECTVFFEVEDTEKPEVSCKDYELVLTSSESVTVAPDSLVDEAIDNCGIAGFSLTQNTFGCNNMGDYPVILSAIDASGNVDTCHAVITVVESEDFPGPWENTDVGSPSEEGFAEYGSCDEAFTIGSGSFGNVFSQEGHFVYQEICGDSEITTKLESVDSLGKSGVMMRETLDSGSKYVSLTSLLTTFVFRSFRTATNGTVTNNQLLRPNVKWLRIVRTNNNFVGYTSTTGGTWQFAFSLTIPMSECIYVGLWVESSNDPTVSVFSNVTITGEPPLIPFAVDESQEERFITQRVTTPEMGIYPNPVTSELNLDLEGWEEERMTLEIRRIGGQLVHAEIVEGAPENMRVDLSPYNLQPGIYFISMRSPQATVTRRFYKAE